ncbi:hypothetical protein E4U21_007668 [Claviceps maximensis]|nr:hypothetical protein E4U21_007668 [Claviceps maximensis]
MTKEENGDTRKRKEGESQTVDSSESKSLTSALLVENTPALAAAGLMLSLIFGGCCSNVYALETIIKFEPSSGTLLTFVQFSFVAITGYVSQFDKSRPPFFIAPARVPLKRWLVNIVLFFSINVLNNHAFSYDISVPVHIILRSGGSITTMIAGYLYGKKYSRIQALAVMLLSSGVVLAAWSDAQEKSKIASAGDKAHPVINSGLFILFFAQVLSAIMGLYTEATYRLYGPHWRENLLYSHMLSLPLFLPFMPSMMRSFKSMAQSAPMKISMPLGSLPVGLEIPSQIVYLGLNVLTQYACIRGVNLLAARTTALTVTIVLNIRKLVSLLLSIWLFENSLAYGTLTGAIIVFGAGALYSLGSQQVPHCSQPEKVIKASKRT